VIQCWAACSVDMDLQGICFVSNQGDDSKVIVGSVDTRLILNSSFRPSFRPSSDKYVARGTKGLSYIIYKFFVMSEAFTVLLSRHFAVN